MVANSPSLASFLKHRRCSRWRHGTWVLAQFNGIRDFREKASPLFWWRSARGDRRLCRCSHTQSAAGFNATGESAIHRLRQCVQQQRTPGQPAAKFESHLWQVAHQGKAQLFMQRTATCVGGLDGANLRLYEVSPDQAQFG